MLPPPAPPPPPFAVALGSGIHFVNITVFGDKFVDFAGDSSLAVQLVHGLQSDQLVEGAWETHVLASLSASDGAIQRISDTVLSLQIPLDVLYDTRAPEVVSVVLPGTLLASKQRTRVEPSFTIVPSRGGATISGMDGIGEGELRDPAARNVLTVTLHDDVWRRDLNLPSGAGVAQQILGGLVARRLYEGGQRLDSTEAAGWDGTVVRQLTAGSSGGQLMRLSDTVVQIVVDQVADFDCVEPEVVELTIPAAAVLSSEVIVASNAVAIRATAGHVAASGSLLDAMERTLVLGATLTLTLSGDEWLADVGRLGASTEALLDGIRSLQSSAAGFNAIVRPRLDHRTIERQSDRVVVLRIPPMADYDIEEPETLVVVVPSL